MTKDEIKQARKSLGLTQGQLAALMGIRQATISDWERGRHIPEGPAVKLMQAYLDGYRPKDGVDMTQFEPRSDEIGGYSEKQIRLESDYTDDELLFELRRRGRFAKVQTEVKVPVRYIREGFPETQMIEEAWKLFAHKAARLHVNGKKPVGVKQWTEEAGQYPAVGDMKHMRFAVNYVVERQGIDTTP